MLGKLRNFFIEARQELRQVKWPTPKEAVYLTWVVVALSIFLAVFLGAFDYLFSYILRILIQVA